MQPQAMRMEDVGFSSKIGTAPRKDATVVSHTVWAELYRYYADGGRKITDGRSEISGTCQERDFMTATRERRAEIRNARRRSPCRRPETCRRMKDSHEYRKRTVTEPFASRTLNGERRDTARFPLLQPPTAIEPQSVVLAR